MDDLLKDFLIEANENISNLDQELVEFERAPDEERLNRIFRAVHSIKGTCGMFGLSRLEKVSHAAEDVLGRMRDRSLAPDSGAIAPILSAVDVIKEILSGLETRGAEPPGDDGEVIRRLERLIGAQSRPAREDEAPTAPGAAPAAAAAAVSDASTVSNQSLRVNVEVLDQLMNMVGELVLNRNQLLQLVRRQDDSQFLQPVQLLNRVTSALQETVMKTRMQPIGNAWSKLPRIVRDTSQSCGKTVELVMTGQGTEIDRQILQAIQDPLTHCVRNSIDHGIEESGRIELCARQEGGSIIIEVKDDGRGVSLERVRAKAVERGLVAAEDAARMSKREVLQLLFLPGFSTAPKVTEISGRGVGMDVVKTNIERVGGTIEIESEEGAGTTVRMKIPLTLAIIPALLIGLGKETFAIPQSTVIELVRLGESGSIQASRQIERVHDASLFRLRDELLPLLDLSKLLCIPGSGHPGYIVVIQAGGRHVGICVDDIFDTQEIVVKPTGSLLRDLGIYAGATILGDGRVVMILDAQRIAAPAAAGAQAQEAEERKEANPSSRPEAGAASGLVLFRAGTRSSRLAVPLSQVARLEEFESSRLEHADGQTMLQYRDRLLRVVAIDGKPPRLSESQKRFQAIVFGTGTSSMALVVDEVYDIVHDRVDLDRSYARAKGGIAGVAVIRGQATVVLDMDRLVSPGEAA